MEGRSGFRYRGDRFCGGGVALSEIADAAGTPFYAYCRRTLESRFDAYSEAFSAFDALICYAMKANSNGVVLRLLGRRGAGMDVVSEGELRRAAAAGIPGERMVFSGVGKTERELATALDMGALQINVESAPELYAAARIARERGMTAPIALRINPDIVAGGHEKIATGSRIDKFGVPWSDGRRLYAEAAALEGVEPVGLAAHIGSQIMQVEPFIRTAKRLVGWIGELRGAGFGVKTVDLGGGLGVADEDLGGAPTAPAAYADALKPILRDCGLRLILEPGRSIVAPAGVLVGRVLYVKKTEAKTFVIVDVGMNDLIRPTLYDVVHPLAPLRRPSPGAPRLPVDLVGPICESGDYLARGVAAPPLRPGDAFALLQTGAYGAALAGEYNSRPLIPEILIDGDRHAVIRKRRSIDEMIAADIVPRWIDDDA